MGGSPTCNLMRCLFYGTQKNPKDDLISSGLSVVFNDYRGGGDG